MNTKVCNFVPFYVYFTGGNIQIMCHARNIKTLLHPPNKTKPVLRSNKKKYHFPTNDTKKKKRKRKRALLGKNPETKKERKKVSRAVFRSKQRRSFPPFRLISSAPFRRCSIDRRERGGVVHLSGIVSKNTPELGTIFHSRVQGVDGTGAVEFGILNRFRVVIKSRVELSRYRYLKF